MSYKVNYFFKLYCLNDIKWIKKNEYASNSFIILKQILLLCYLKAVSCTQ